MQAEGNGAKRKLHVPVPGHRGIYTSERAGGKSVFEVRYTDSTGRRVYEVAGQKLSDAKAKLAEVTHKKATTGIVSSTATLTDVYKDWMETRDIRPGSKRTFDHLWKIHIEPALGTRKVRYLDDLTIERFLRGLKRADGKPGLLASGTQRLILATLGIILGHAVRMHLITAVPKLPAKSKPKAGEGRTRILSHDEERTLLAYCAPFPWLRSVVTIALHQALRLGEIASVRWEDVDFVTGTVTVVRTLLRDGSTGPTKGGKVCTIPLTSAAREALLELRLEADGTGFIFQNRYGKPRSLRDIQRAFNKARQRAGLGADVCFHSLRHTSISRLANHPELALVTVRDFARHANLVVTQGYVHKIEDEKVKVSINEALTGAVT